jgi:hypothetical protein
MYKKADDSQAHRAKHHDGADEFPIWRLSENIGYGITDNLTVRGAFGYTYDGDIDRKGMHEGRIGLNYRILPDAGSLAWDVYADAFMGGVSKMEAELIMVDPGVVNPPFGFNYANYANGRWGAWLGTQVGKTWDKFTAVAFAEVERTFGNNNNAITVSTSARTLLNSMIGGAAAFVPDEFTIDTKSTWEYSAGLKGFYEIDEVWSLGGAFAYKHRSDNTIEAVNIPPANTGNASGDATINAALNALKGGFVGNLHDGWDEYVLGLSVANQLTNSVQVALYGEYTFDDAHKNSQNGTDVKAEVGVRVNVAF